MGTDRQPIEQTREATGREFGRDGVTGMVNRDRALRAREVSRPEQSDLKAASDAVARLVARASGRR